MPRRIAQERVPYRVQCRVARCDMGLPAPHFSSSFASFRVFRGPHSLGKAGRFAYIDFGDLAPVFRLAYTAAFVVAASPRSYLLFNFLCFLLVRFSLFRAFLFLICLPFGPR